MNSNAFGIIDGFSFGSERFNRGINRAYAFRFSNDEPTHATATNDESSSVELAGLVSKIGDARCYELGISELFDEGACTSTKILTSTCQFRWRHDVDLDVSSLGCFLS